MNRDQADTFATSAVGNILELVGEESAMSIVAAFVVMYGHDRIWEKVKEFTTKPLGEGNRWKTEPLSSKD